MEASVGFKYINERISGLERQLALYDVKAGEELTKQMEEEIEDHFAKCMQALALRKVRLMKELEQKSNIQKKNVEENRAKLRESIETFKQVLKAGAQVYSLDKNAAEDIWKRTKNLPIPHSGVMKMRTKLPHSFLESIQNHGKVSFDTFSTVEMVSTLNTTVDSKSVPLGSPYSMCFNPLDDCLYICDCDSNSIKKLTMKGEMSTFANTGLSQPVAIAMNHEENCFYVANYKGDTVSKINSSGSSVVFAGGGRGSADGMGAKATFHNIYGIAIDQQSGLIFVADYENCRIRKITPEGDVTTFAGSKTGFLDGNGKEAQFRFPWGIFFDEVEQSLLVCDYYNNLIRKIQFNGDVSTVCRINDPAHVVMTPNRVIFATSFSDDKIYKITQEGTQYKSTVLAGSGVRGKKDGVGEKCKFNRPCGILVHEASHSLYVSEVGNGTIRKICFTDT